MDKHICGADQPRGHAQSEAPVPGGAPAATCILVQRKVCLAHSGRAYAQTDTMFPGHSRMGTVRMNGHIMNVLRKYSATQNSKFPKASVISSEFFTVTPKVAPVGSGSPYFGLRLLYSPPPGGASVNNNLVSVSIEYI